MTALELYLADRENREAGYLEERQQYYCSLRDAAYRELTENGFCQWLEELVAAERAGKLESLYVLDYAVLMECFNMAALGRDMRDATLEVPYLRLRGTKAAWAQVEKPGNHLVPLSRDVAEKMRILRSVCFRMVQARDEAIITNPNPASPHELENVKYLNQMLEERCQALADERDGLKKRLELAEQGIITETVNNAIRERRIREEEKLRRSLEDQTRAAAEAFRRQYEKEQTDANARREEEERLLTGIRAQAAGDYAGVRKEIAGDLQSLTALLTGKLAAWQQGLDRAECRMLADSYLSLHDLLNGEMAPVMLTAQCEGASEAVITALTGLETSLRGRLRQLETAMIRMGLIILRPARGDALDSMLHLPVGLSIGAVGDTQVKRCLRPGVMLQGQKEAMVKAQVETE